MMLRVTIMLDNKIANQLRKKQAKLIKTSQKSISFSNVINESLKLALKKDRTVRQA